MAGQHLQGKFRPRNPHKYKGDANNIVFRSSYELKFFKYCDLTDSVLKWSSEEVVVPYKSPTTGKTHRYFVDCWLKYRKDDGEIEQKLIEIKPRAQVMPPKKQERKTKQYIRKVETWVINNAKWEAAKAYAEKNKMTFHIITEHELGIK